MSQYTMPSGSRFAGEPIDTSRSHPVVVRGEVDDEAFGGKGLIVDHIYHNGKFWTAVIPTDGVEAVFLQVFNFSTPRSKWGSRGKTALLDRKGMPKRRNPFLNHLQVRMTFHADQPVQLYPLFKVPDGNPTHSLSDLCYSVEAAGPKGYEFNLRNTLFGHLVSVHRFTTMQEMVFERIVTEDQCLTESPALPLTKSQRKHFLLKTLFRSQQAGLSERYYLLRIARTNNCTSNALEILDSVAKDSLRQRLARLFYRLPLSPRLYMRLRGMDSNPKVVKLVRDEFVDFINDPKTQSRRQSFLESQCA